MTGSVNILIQNFFGTPPPYILFRICQDLEAPRKSAKHFIFLQIKNRILFILILILSMSLVLLTGPNLAGPIHWTGFVLLVLIIHIMFNSTRSPGIHGQSKLIRAHNQVCHTSKPACFLYYSYRMLVLRKLLL